MTITTIAQLKKDLKKMSASDRLQRHASVEIALTEEKDKSDMLTKALKQSQLECAGLRSQLKNIIEAHGPLERRG